MPDVAMISMDNYNDASKLVCMCVCACAVRGGWGPVGGTCVDLHGGACSSSIASCNDAATLAGTGMGWSGAVRAGSAPGRGRMRSPRALRRMGGVTDAHTHATTRPQIDSNFDDPRLTDYELLLSNLADLRQGRATEVRARNSKAQAGTGPRAQRALWARPPPPWTRGLQR